MNNSSILALGHRDRETSPTNKPDEQLSGHSNPKGTITTDTNQNLSLLKIAEIPKNPSGYLRKKERNGSETVTSNQHAFKMTQKKLTEKQNSIS